MNNPPVLRTAINFGAMSGLANFIFFLLLYWMGFNPLGPASNLGFWIPILIMCLATRYYKKYDGNGFITYWQGYRTSFLTATFGALLFALLLFIFGTVVDAGIVERVKADNLAMFDQNEKVAVGLYGEQLYDNLIEQIQNTNIKTISMQEYFSRSFFGLIIAFITAAFFTKKPSIIQHDEVQP